MKYIFVRLDSHELLHISTSAENRKYKYYQKNLNPNWLVQWNEKQTKNTKQTKSKAQVFGSPWKKG